jgi:hypothetical protein
VGNERFAYQVVDVKANLLGGMKPQTLQEELNRLGAQGWELVSVTPNHGFGVRLYLKRSL